MSLNFLFPGYVGSRYRQSRIHPTKNGPGRSVGMKPKQRHSGVKVARKAHEGMITMRNGCGAAGRLALEGNLRYRAKCKK